MTTSVATSTFTPPLVSSVVGTQTHSPLVSAVPPTTTTSAGAHRGTAGAPSSGTPSSGQPDMFANFASQADRLLDADRRAISTIIDAAISLQGTNGLHRAVYDNMQREVCNHLQRSMDRDMLIA
ncbi:hypothetical protein GOP47_0027166 [Adiantum capillus-veneris]|nr:hypothetical protein GOP47_0027166 [Adiantum capillus-veneris]